MRLFKQSDLLIELRAFKIIISLHISPVNYNNFIKIYKMLNINK